MDKDIVSMGIDLSLTGTGVVLLRNGKIEHKDLIKTKPSGERPVDELKRLFKIVDMIAEARKASTVDIAVIENLAFGVRNATSLTQLAGLSYFTREYLYGEGIPFVLVAPNSLKKFVAGDGKAKKDQMMLETYKRYGVSLLDDNICDAYGLAQIGLVLKDANSKVTTKVQEEVISLLRKQL